MSSDEPDGAGKVEIVAEPFWFTTLLVEKPSLVALASFASVLFWLALLPVFGLPVIDTGGEAFQVASGEIAMNQFKFFGGLRDTLGTGVVPSCEDVAIKDIPGVTTSSYMNVMTLLRNNNISASKADCPTLIQLLKAEAPAIAKALGAGATNFSISCDTDIKQFAKQIKEVVGIPVPAGVTYVHDLCPATCKRCGDGGSTKGERAERATQTHLSNILTLTYESQPGGKAENSPVNAQVLTAANIQRICDAERDITKVPDFQKFCFKPGGGGCAVTSLCAYMQPATSTSFALPRAIPVCNATLKLFATCSTDCLCTSGYCKKKAASESKGQCAKPASPKLVGVAAAKTSAWLQVLATENPLLYQYSPTIRTLPKIAGLAPNGTFSGGALFGRCAALSLGGNNTHYTVLTMSGCFIPTGGGAMVSAPIAHARAMTKSGNPEFKLLFTKAFYDGTTDQLQATRTRIMFGIPYKVGMHYLPLAGSAEWSGDDPPPAEKPTAQCQALLEEKTVLKEGEAMSALRCEPATTWLGAAIAPQYTLTTDALIDEWWHVLSCARRQLSFNAQCVEELNKLEEQRKFARFASVKLMPQLSDIMHGRGAYSWSGEEGELRFMWTEFSQLVQQYFDEVIVGDGLKALFAMVFSFLYIMFHTRDVGYSILGMSHILMSIPVSLSLYVGPCGFGRFNTLCFLGIFVILGIGADDIFIMVDCWKQSKRYFEADDLESRMAWAWRRAAIAMLTTTLTTAAAFFINLISPIPPVAVFGVFSGLLVVTNYLLVITWFPAVIIMKEKKLGPYYVIAYCGCCLLPLVLSWQCWLADTQGKGMFAAADRSADDADLELEDSTDNPVTVNKMALGDDAGEEGEGGKGGPSSTDEAAEGMSAMERFFFSTYAPALDRAKMVVIPVTAVVIVVMAIVALQLEPAEDAAAFLPPTDPLQRVIDLSATMGIKVFDGADQQQFVNIFFGVKDVDRSDVDFLNGNDLGEVQFDPAFPAAIASKAAQLGVVKLCEALRDKSRANNQYVQRVFNPRGEIYCPMEGFRDWLTKVRKLPFPVAGGEAKFAPLAASYSEYVRAVEGISTKGKTSYILLKGDQPLDQMRFAMTSSSKVRQLRMLSVMFNTTIKFNSPASVVQPMLDTMDDFLKEVNAWMPEGCKATQTCVRYRGVRTEQALLSSAIYGTIISLGIAFVCILGATMNIAVTALAMVMILATVVSVVASMVAMGWTLGVIQSICITIVVGLSVDYNVHLVHIFAESPERSRFEKARDALSSMGVSVFSAAMTTLGSAFVLALTYIKFFQSFGTFVFLNILFSTLYAFVGLTAVLMAWGPMDEQGELRALCKEGSAAGEQGGEDEDDK